MTSSVRETLPTADMAKALGISEKLLLRLRKSSDSPFQMGTHYRFQGTSTLAPVRWFPAPTDEAFSSFQRLEPAELETMTGDEL